MKMMQRVLAWALMSALAAGLAVAQSESGSDSGDRTNAESQSVYTTDDLKKLDENKSPSVFTNDSLDEEPAAAAPAANESYTNKDLSERFGNEGRGPEAPEGEAPAAEAAPAEPAPEAPSEPAMTDEERAKRIADLEQQIQELQKQLDALRDGKP